jgi:hypothetical protein
MVMVTDILWREVPPQRKYPLLFQHSAISEDPSLTSEFLLNQSDIMTSFGHWDSNFFTDG